MSHKDDEKFENLQFIRVFDPIHIPVYLVDQIRDKEFTTEAFYEYQKEICVQREGKNYILNPYNLLFIIANEEKKTCGFLWAVVDVFTQCLVINTFSMDREWWGGGRAVNLLREKAIEIAKGAHLKKIYWITNHPKHSKKYGFKASKSVLMEYKIEEEEKENGTDISGEPRETNGNSTVDDPSSTAVSSEYSRPSIAAGTGSVREFITGR